MRDLRVQVASSPDRDDVEVELLIADEVAGTLYEAQDGNMRVRVYPPTPPVLDWTPEELAKGIEMMVDRFERLGPKRA